MPKFAFKLEAVLRQRQAAEDERQRALGAARAAMAAMHDELRGLEESTRAAVEEVRLHHLNGRLDIAYVAGHGRYVGAMQRTATDLGKRIAAQQAVVDEARRLLLHAAIQRKMLEKLRERHALAWIESANLRERAMLAEVNMQREIDESFDRGGSGTVTIGAVEECAVAADPPRVGGDP